MTILRVKDIEPGQVIEMVYGSDNDPWLTGNVYLIGKTANHLTGDKYAYPRFTNHRITLHANNRCVLANEYRDNEGRWT